MKIEKLNKDNIKDFIRDMKLTDTENLELNIDKNEFYGVKKEDTFYIGFDSLSSVDTIAILHYSPKLSNELFYECMEFLNKNLVAQSHLIIEIYDEKYMYLLDEKYKCKEAMVSLAIDGSTIEKENISSNNLLMKEKFADVDMKSIKYYTSKDMVICNLVKQNIQDENIIMGLHNEFINLNIKYINFTILADYMDYFNEIGYKCMSKSYVIRNDLF